MSESLNPLEQAAWEKLQTLVQRHLSSVDDTERENLRREVEALAISLKDSGASVPGWAKEERSLRKYFAIQDATLDAPADATGPFPVGVPSTSEPTIEAVPVSNQPTTPEQLEEAESLIRQAKVFQMRNQRKEAGELLQRAATVAPNASNVLEALGDEYMAQRKTGEAKAMYDRARKADPNNISADRKFAELVFSAVKANMDYTRYADSEVVANSKSAAVLSFFFPGIGQMVMGEWVKGVIFFVVAFTCWALSRQFGLFDLILVIGGKNANLNPSLFLTLAIAFITHFAASADAGIKGKATIKKKVEHPVPPSNLPFE